ncbi:MAG: CopG family ribbon-helix-helix protein [Candidatus Baldrarchaeia archaeon]|nr:ribbon-helix-helix domain-containing protein [Candidatus Baldrarchaeota archaeon]
MSVISIRIDEEVIKELNNLRKLKGYKSLNEVIKEAIKEYILKNKSLWSSREEVYNYFKKKNKKIRGLEDIHREEEL